jgi:hypothetical protein
VSDELCVVFESQGPLGAEVARSKLEAAGVPCMLKYEAVGRALGLTVDGLGLVRVLVACDDQQRALEILAEDGGPYDGPFGDAD